MKESEFILQMCMYVGCVVMCVGVRCIGGVYMWGCVTMCQIDVNLCIFLNDSPPYFPRQCPPMIQGFINSTRLIRTEPPLHSLHTIEIILNTDGAEKVSEVV